MPGQQQQVTEQSQNSQTAPWSPTQPALQSLISQLASLGGSTSADQTNALSNLGGAVGSIPTNLGPDAAAGVGRLYGADTTGQIGMLNKGFDALNTNIGATARGEELDPYKTPGFSDAIARATGDITDRVKGVYNASGRDPSGAGSFAGSLGRGLTEGIAPTIASQFNTNNANRFSAANQLYTQQQQMPLDNVMRAITASGAIPGLYTAPAEAGVNVANRAQALPYENLSRYLQGILPIAALGSQSQGTGRSTRTQDESTMGNIIGGASGAAGLLTGLFGGGGAGGAGALAGMLALSDKRTKENIAEVGELHDGQPVYSFNYIGDERPQIGLMAQEVERVRPEAVHDIGGVKFVDYAKATRGARRIGLMADMLEAA